MKNIKHLVSVFALLFSMGAQAQDWDRERYPDYNPSFSNPDSVLLKYGKPTTRKKAKAMAKKMGLPDHVNNANTRYFPPVFNQSGGSCGSASRIGYMFTHELNAYRDANGSDPRNQYPTHFVWLLTNGNSGKDAFVTNVGVPSAATYGGQTYGRLYGPKNETDNDFGWMTGYDKWFEAMGNRMNKPTTNPFSLGTEEGRLAAKAWLYNHAGDDSFRAGGLIGLGVASGGEWGYIPSTETNDAIGVSDMYYVKRWGNSVDHALTMVGYDDRIEFDLDGNGVYGEESKDEKGAWIIVNSWGKWCNDGFIYCPYAYAGSHFNKDSNGNYSWSGNWWYGELYHTRKDYRPLRTIKLKMNYSRRSEILLQAGISRDLTADKPESIIQFDHFKYAGDGNHGNTVPAPEVPMLGKWADGRMHNEPMEFGYDLTDLTSGYDRNQPLKYFFIINTKSTAVGNGNIYAASIIDYENDLQGIETPFNLGNTGKVEVKNAGEQTIISVIVYGAAFHPVQNLSAIDGTLTWDAPLNSAHTLEEYLIFKEGKEIAHLNANTRSFACPETGTYSVVACYENGGKSNKETVSTTVQRQTPNKVINLAHGGFKIPDIFNTSYQECTIEFYIKPNSLANWNNAFGPGWGSFFAHCNANGMYNVGWNTNGNRIDSQTKLTTGAWTHIAIVVKGKQMSLYMGRTFQGAVSSNEYSGIGGFGDLVFISSEGNNHYQDALYDEIRIWDRARTDAEIKNSYNREFYGDVMPDGLLAYYKGDIIEMNGNSYLRDCVGGHHALLTNANFTAEVPATQPTLFRPKDTENILSINAPTETVYAGIPTTLTTTRGDGIRTLSWEAPEAGLQNSKVTKPSLTFPAAGNYTVKVTGSDYEADGTTGVPREISHSLTINVQPAPQLDASFTCTSNQVGSGDRVNFHVTNPVKGYAYTWTMPGGDVAQATTLSAATAYQAAGQYEVTLTVTDPQGQSKQQTQQITVSEVAPEADFTLSDGVVLKGQPVCLTSTSKHQPTALEWTLSNKVQNTIIQQGKAEQHFTPQSPGVYNITLKASNNSGTSSKLQERALIVCNDDSKNGLSFNQSAAQVTLSKPLFEGGSTNALTLDWWMKPTKLVNYCLGIGESTSTFMLRTDAQGRMFFHNDIRTVSSEPAFVTADEWHHYAVAFGNDYVRFIRDGKVISTVNGAGSTLKCPASFSIGTSSAQMTGSIDEFRVWKSIVGDKYQQTWNNEEMDDPELYITGEKASYKLLLYYKFNQNSGNVVDATTNGNTGIRTGFGPDGDAWDLSKGVFCLNYSSQQPDEIINTIQDVNASSTATVRQGTFDLSGRNVSKPAVHGVYIINGKKVIR